MKVTLSAKDKHRKGGRRGGRERNTGKRSKKVSPTPQQQEFFSPAILRKKNRQGGKKRDILWGRMRGKKEREREDVKMEGGKEGD